MLLTLAIEDCSYSLSFSEYYCEAWPIDAVWIQARDFHPFESRAHVHRCRTAALRLALKHGSLELVLDEGSGSSLACRKRRQAAAAGGSGSSSSRKATTKREIDGGTGLRVTGVGGRSVTANHPRFRRRHRGTARDLRGCGGSASYGDNFMRDVGDDTFHIPAA